METLFYVKSAGHQLALWRCFDWVRESREIWGRSKLECGNLENDGERSYKCVMREEGAADIGNFRVNICIPESFFEVKVAAFLPTWSFLGPLYRRFIKL
jgi:hypothetical protein